MARRIKCRGWSPDLNDWVYGAYFKHCNCLVAFSEDDKPEYHEAKIIFEQMGDWGFPGKIMIADVVPESVGEFTGCALNGKEVYEGDVVRFGLDDGGLLGIVTYGEYKNPCESIDTKHMGFYIDWPGAGIAKGNSVYSLRKDLAFWINDRAISIVSNVYEDSRKTEVPDDKGVR